MDHNYAIATMKLAIGLGIIGAAYNENGDQVEIVWENVIDSVYRTLRHPDFVNAVKQVAIEASTQPGAKKFDVSIDDPTIGYADQFGARNAAIKLDLKTKKPYYELFGKRIGIIDETGQMEIMIAKYYANNGE